MKGGLSTQLEVDQAIEPGDFCSRRRSPMWKRRREQAENFLSTLLGRNPGPVDTLQGPGVIKS